MGADCLMVQGGDPLSSLLSFARKHMVHILNLYPRMRVGKDWRSPRDIFRGHKDSTLLSSLRTLFCYAVAYLHPEQRSSDRHRGVECVYLGWCTNRKAHLFVPIHRTGRLLFSAVSAHFDETVFPFQKANSLPYPIRHHFETQPVPTDIVSEQKQLQRYKDPEDESPFVCRQEYPTPVQDHQLNEGVTSNQSNEGVTSNPSETNQTSSPEPLQTSDDNQTQPDSAQQDNGSAIDQMQHNPATHDNGGDKLSEQENKLETAKARALVDSQQDIRPIASGQLYEQKVTELNPLSVDIIQPPIVNEQSVQPLIANDQPAHAMAEPDIPEVTETKRSQRQWRPSTKILEHMANSNTIASKPDLVKYVLLTVPVTKCRDGLYRYKGMVVQDIPVPKNKKTANSLFKTEWDQADQEEWDELWDHGTFVPVLHDDPEVKEAKVIGTMFTRRLKFNEREGTLRFKARLCVRGDQIFASVLNLKTFRAVLACSPTRRRKNQTLGLQERIRFI